MHNCCKEIPCIRFSEELRLEMETKFLNWPENKRNECNCRGETALIASLRLGCADHVISHLIDLGCDVNIPDKLLLSPLHIAAMKMNGAVIRKLLQSGANINARDGAGNTALHKAMIYRRVPIVEALLSHPDIEYDAKNNTNETALFLSRIWKRTFTFCDISPDIEDEAVIAALLNRGCDINLTNGASHETVLHRTLMENDRRAVETFIRRGADLHVRDMYQTTPLHTAILHSCNEIIYMLLYFGADGEDTDINEETPLAMALYKRNEEIAEYLLLYTPNLNHLNTKGIPLLHIALRHSANIALKMIEAGADVNTATNGENCIFLSLCSNCRTMELFQAIWSRIDIKLFLRNRSQHANPDYFSIIDMMVHNVTLSNDHFLKSLFMIFESPHIDLIVQNHRDLRGFDCLSLYHTFRRCKFDLSLDEKLKITYLFLYHNIEIYYDDIHNIYCECGFDEYVELMLKHGDQLRHLEYAGDTNLLFWRIWYNHFHRFPDTMDFLDEDEIEYKQFFRANFDCDMHVVGYPYIITEVPSLVQLSRDVIRDVIYKNWTTKQYFRVYQVLSQLPVPPLIRDILYLKIPIYKIEDKL
ncbi:hypothetical protein Trydic_g12624 [Trypoxylus dichotomus]